MIFDFIIMTEDKNNFFSVDREALKNHFPIFNRNLYDYCQAWGPGITLSRSTFKYKSTREVQFYSTAHLLITLRTSSNSHLTN